MPSTVVHLALAGLLAAALLREEFDARSLALVLVVAAIPDLDAFLGLAIDGAHRAALHTLLVPAFGAVAIAYDTRIRRRSFLRSRWETRGVRIAWVAVAVYAFAGIGLDFFSNGVNVFYPLYDQFFKLDGELLVSNQRGLVQTFVDLSPPQPSGGETAGSSAASSGGGGGQAAVGSTADVHYSTGVDPSKGAEPEAVERVFPIVRAGWQLLLLVTSAAVVTVRLVERHVTNGVVGR